ncbi:endonuclease III domain-containing protein [Dehalogenimonas sp. 4OHTPN]|uniref:Endonuclease III domain-containing protein n=1 Tax=Dehalogenimonas sp. 4OHTPN TaxID=3166643 RepID=A0AAU8G974_9CHLR
MGDASPAEKLKAVYRLLLERYGPQRWWPGETPFEVMTGAVLTQSAAWGNVEKAIGNLKAAGKLSAAALRDIPAADLAVLIYPSGYYNAKARKLKALVEWLGNYGDDLSRLDRRDSQGLREELLGVHGIGPETADSILLYALGRPIFVIDAYTRRLYPRLGIKPDRDTYDSWQRLFMANLPHEAASFNEYHALIVRHGKESCRKKPRCRDCCLSELCPAFSP